MLTNRLSRRGFLKMLAVSSVTIGAAGLAGCAPAVMPGQQSGAAAPAAAKVSLRKMAWGSPLEKANIENGLSSFMEANPDVEVEYIHTPERYMEVLQTMLAANNAPDVFKIGGNFYPDLAVKGALLDITDQVAGDPILGDPDFFFPLEEKRSTVDGKWYGIGSTFQWRLFYYNVAALAEAGVEPPSTEPGSVWSWDQFLEAGRALTRDSNGRHPGDGDFNVQNVEQWGTFVPEGFYENYVFSNGGAVFNESNQYALDAPEAYEAIQIFADLWLKERVAPHGSVLQETGMNAWQMLATGRVAMIQDGNWALQDISKMEFDFGVGVLPMLKQPATLVGSSWTSIYASTPNVEPSWRLFQYLNLDDYQSHLVRVGLWGVSHKTLLTPEGVETWWDPAVHPDNWLPMETDYKLNYGHVHPNVVGTLRSTPMLTQALSEVWTGARAAEDVLIELTPQLNQVLAEEQAKI
ncbi:MAG: extracellular solute-binding protein [Caldilineaceae bacterium]|nr:extracellular solute-binding protein [Caldilineaceae bacterium]